MCLLQVVTFFSILPIPLFRSKFHVFHEFARFTVKNPLSNMYANWVMRSSKTNIQQVFWYIVINQHEVVFVIKITNQKENCSFAVFPVCVIRTVRPSRANIKGWKANHSEKAYERSRKNSFAMLFVIDVIVVIHQRLLEYCSFVIEIFVLKLGYSDVVLPLTSFRVILNRFLRLMLIWLKWPWTVTDW